MVVELVSAPSRKTDRIFVLRTRKQGGPKQTTEEILQMWSYAVVRWWPSTFDPAVAGHVAAVVFVEVGRKARFEIEGPTGEAKMDSELATSQCRYCSRQGYIDLRTNGVGLTVALLQAAFHVAAFPGEEAPMSEAQVLVP